MTTTTQQLIERADLAIADLNANGGLLLPEQANRFIDFVLDEPTVLRQSRVERMNAPEKKINRMGFADRILRAARQSGGANDDGSNDRYLRKADRAKPATTQLTINTSEVMAEVRLPYEVLEDNIEGRSVEEHIMRQIAERVALDLEEYALWADTTSADEYLALQNGWMKRCNVNISDNASAGITPDVFSDGMLALPQKYLKYLPQLRAYVSMANTIRYRRVVSRRETGYGDSALQKNIPLEAHGLQIEGAPLLAAYRGGNDGLITFPKNLIFGIRRDISIETDKDIRSREHIIVVTLRAGMQVDDPDASVKLKDI
jgi:hypothetical protein